MIILGLIILLVATTIYNYKYLGPNPDLKRILAVSVKPAIIALITSGLLRPIFAVNVAAFEGYDIIGYLLLALALLAVPLVLALILIAFKDVEI